MGLLEIIKFEQYSIYEHHLKHKGYRLNLIEKPTNLIFDEEEYKSTLKNNITNEYYFAFTDASIIEQMAGIEI